MDFQRSGNNRRMALFEIDPTTKHPERYVAMSALGLSVARARSDSERRLPPAVLGMKIAQLQAPQTPPLASIDTAPSPMGLIKADATTLAQALWNYHRDTPLGIMAVVNMNPHSASVRAVEGDIASVMAEQLKEEFSLPDKLFEQEAPFGFR